MIVGEGFSLFSLFFFLFSFFFFLFFFFFFPAHKVWGGLRWVETGRGNAK